MVRASTNHLLAVIVLYATSSAACSDSPITNEQALGHYVLNTNDVSDKIDVLPNGRYVHRMKVSGQAVADTGSWSIDENDRSAIEFKQFRFRISQFGPSTENERAPSSRTLWVARVERSRFRGVQLIVNGDVGLAYVKQDSVRK